MVTAALSGMLAGLLGFLGLGPSERPPTPRSVSPPVVAGKASAGRGTMVLIHGGAWRGPDAEHQQSLVHEPGELLVKRGWRVVSVDYKQGQPGLQDILDAIGQEIVQPSGRLLCVYGESAGAQLALIAAARVPAVDCVVAAGAPTDFHAYFAEAEANRDASHRFVADTIRSIFGATPEATAPWDPIRNAGAIDADVLLLRQAYDPLIPPEQVTRFLTARPTTEAIDLEAGDPAKPEEAWVHGALSAKGRADYVASIASFVDRAAAAHRVAMSGSRARCGAVNRRLQRVGEERFRKALRCLARRGPRAARARAARRVSTTTRMPGEVTAARAWAALRRTRAGRRQLAALAAGRARASVEIASPSLLVVRPTARRARVRPRR